MQPEQEKAIREEWEALLNAPLELASYKAQVLQAIADGCNIDIETCTQTFKNVILEYAHTMAALKLFVSKKYGNSAEAKEYNSILDEHINLFDEIFGEDKAEEVQEIALSVISRSGFTYLATSKANGLQPVISQEGALGVDVGGKGDKHACISVSIKTPDNKPINPQERELQEAAGALMQRCDKEKPIILSVDQIYKEFAGLQPGATVRPEKIKEMEKTLDRLRKCDAVIDFTQQAKKHAKPGVKVDCTIIERALIPAEKVTATINGRTTVGYRFYEYPPFYQYSADVNQIAKVEQKLLNASAEAGSTGSRRNSDDFIVLKRVILKRLERMKFEADRKGGKYERRRSYAKIYSEVLGTDKPSVKKAEKMRSDIDKYLTALQEQGYIKGFSKYRKGRAYAGIEIDL